MSPRTHNTKLISSFPKGCAVHMYEHYELIEA
jgi:hypothetical protein